MKSRAVKLFCLGAVLTVVTFAASDVLQQQRMGRGTHVGQDDQKTNFLSYEMLRDQLNKLKKEYYGRREQQNSWWKSMQHDHWAMSGMACTLTAAQRMKMILDKMTADGESVLASMSSTLQEAKGVLELADQMEDDSSDEDQNLIRNLQVFLAEVTRTLRKTKETNNRRRKRVCILSSIVQRLTSVPEEQSAQVDSVIPLIEQFYELCEEWEICWNKQRETKFTLKQDGSFPKFIQTMEQLQGTLAPVGDMKSVFEKLVSKMSPLLEYNPWLELNRDGLLYFRARRKEIANAINRVVVHSILSPIRGQKRWYHERQKEAIEGKFGAIDGLIKMNKKWCLDDVKELYDVLKATKSLPTF